MTTNIDPQRVERFCKELIRRGLTWKDAEVHGLRIHRTMPLSSWMVTIDFAVYQNEIPLEQFLFDSRFELAKCLWATTQHVCPNCERQYTGKLYVLGMECCAYCVDIEDISYMPNWKGKLNEILYAEDRLSYLVEALESEQAQTSEGGRE